MSDINLTINGTKRLLTAGKYCESDIVVTAEGGAEDLDAVLTEQESLIASLQATLEEKAMEQVEDLDAVLTEQESLIATLQDMLRNKANGGGDNDLPDGYRRADYIQFNGLNAVDTGIICDQNTKIKIYFIRESTTAQYLYGVTSSGNTASLTAYMSSSGAWRFGNTYINRTISIDPEIVHLAVVSKSGIKFETGTSSYGTVNDFETPGTLILGGVRQTDGSVDTQFDGKALMLEMWSGEEQVLRLIPVTDGTSFRFWDSISEKFCDSATDTPLSGGNM